jgi:hypothetical protein
LGRATCRPGLARLLVLTDVLGDERGVMIDRPAGSGTSWARV